MSKLFTRGLKRMRHAFSEKKGKNFKKRLKHQQRLHDIEQEVEQSKDKLLRQAWW